MQNPHEPLIRVVHRCLVLVCCALCMGANLQLHPSGTAAGGGNTGLGGTCTNDSSTCCVDADCEGAATCTGSAAGQLCFKWLSDAIDEMDDTDNVTEVWPGTYTKGWVHRYDVEWRPGDTPNPSAGGDDDVVLTGCGFAQGHSTTWFYFDESAEPHPNTGCTTCDFTVRSKNDIAVEGTHDVIFDYASEAASGNISGFWIGRGIGTVTIEDIRIENIYQGTVCGRPFGSCSTSGYDCWTDDWCPGAETCDDGPTSKIKFVNSLVTLANTGDQDGLVTAYMMIGNTTGTPTLGAEFVDSVVRHDAEGLADPLLMFATPDPDVGTCNSGTTQVDRDGTAFTGETCAADADCTGPASNTCGTCVGGSKDGDKCSKPETCGSGYCDSVDYNQRNLFRVFNSDLTFTRGQIIWGSSGLSSHRGGTMTLDSIVQTGILPNHGWTAEPFTYECDASACAGGPRDGLSCTLHSECGYMPTQFTVQNSIFYLDSEAARGLCEDGGGTCSPGTDCCTQGPRKNETCVDDDDCHGCGQYDGAWCGGSVDSGFSGVIAKEDITCSAGDEGNNDCVLRGDRFNDIYETGSGGRCAGGALANYGCDVDGDCPSSTCDTSKAVVSSYLYNTFVGFGVGWGKLYHQESATSSCHNGDGSGARCVNRFDAYGNLLFDGGMMNGRDNRFVHVKDGTLFDQSNLWFDFNIYAGALTQEVTTDSRSASKGWLCGDNLSTASTDNALTFSQWNTATNDLTDCDIPVGQRDPNGAHYEVPLYPESVGADTSDANIDANDESFFTGYSTMAQASRDWLATRSQVIAWLAIPSAGLQVDAGGEGLCTGSPFEPCYTGGPSCTSGTCDTTPPSGLAYYCPPTDINGDPRKNGTNGQCDVGAVELQKASAGTESHSGVTFEGASQ